MRLGQDSAPTDRARTDFRGMRLKKSAELVTHVDRHRLSELKRTVHPADSSTDDAPISIRLARNTTIRRWFFGAYRC
jgi:hypothetical protein